MVTVKKTQVQSVNEHSCRSRYTSAGDLQIHRSRCAVVVEHAAELLCAMSPAAMRNAITFFLYDHLTQHANSAHVLMSHTPVQVSAGWAQSRVTLHKGVARHCAQLSKPLCAVRFDVRV